MTDNGQPDEVPAPPVYECPNCSQPIDAAAAASAQLVSCPHCGEHVLIPALDGSTELTPEQPAADEPTTDSQSEQSELDALRMRHIIVVRRAAIRSRTYNILGVAACLMAATKLVIVAIHEIRLVGLHARQTSFMVFALALIYFAWHFLARARAWARESRGAKAPDPQTPPDFSTLSDGSQHARHLAELHSPQEPPAP